MNTVVLQIIKSFKSKKKDNYNDFLAHVYKTFDDKINSCRVEKLKNKYKKMRESILEYIVSNEEQIISKINKHS